MYSHIVGIFFYFVFQKGRRVNIISAFFFRFSDSLLQFSPNCKQHFHVHLLLSIWACPDKYKKAWQNRLAGKCSSARNNLSMAQDLPFSVANILRSDFPPPSRISKIPKLLRIAPLSEYTKIPVSIPYHLDRGISRGFFTYGSPMLLSCSEEDVFHSPAHKKDQQVKPSTETPREGKFMALFIDFINLSTWKHQI